MSTLPIIVAAVLYSTYGIQSRFLHLYYGPFSQGVFTSLFGILLTWFLTRKAAKSTKFTLHYPIWLGVFVIFSTTTGIFFYLAANNLTLGTTLFLFYAASTIISYAIGALFHTEPLTPKKLTALTLALIGLVIIFNLSFTFAKIGYLLSGLAAGASFALYTTSTKTLSRKYSKELMTLIRYLATFVIYLALTLLWEQKTILSVGALTTSLIVTVVITVTAFLTIIGFKQLPIHQASLILLLDPMLATIWGIIFYSEKLNPQFLLGAAIILVAMSLPHLSLARKPT